MLNTINSPTTINLQIVFGIGVSSTDNTLLKQLKSSIISQTKAEVRGSNPFRCVNFFNKLAGYTYFSVSIPPCVLRFHVFRNG